MDNLADTSKRWLSVLVALCLGTIPVIVSGQPIVGIETVTNESPGTSVAVPVRVEQLNSDIGLPQFVIHFDNSGLEFEGLTNEVNDRDFDWNDPSPGEVKISIFSSTPISIDGTSATLFEMVFSFDGGARTISFSEEESFLEDENGNRLSASFEDGGISDEDTLPVELTAFTAVQDGPGGVKLSWRTVSEQNNAGFSIQHREGEDPWSRLGFLESAVPGGTTTQAQTYEYAVGTLRSGRHEFRLVQKDLDGTLHPSESVSIHLDPQNQLFLSVPAPHPVSGSSTLSFTVAETGPVSLHLFNLLGQNVATLYHGRPSSGEQVSVPFSGKRLSPGTYVLRLQSRNGTVTRRITVVR